MTDFVTNFFHAVEADYVMRKLEKDGSSFDDAAQARQHLEQRLERIVHDMERESHSSTLH